MTTIPTTTEAPAHEPAPIILQPELAVSSEVVATIRRLLDLAQHGGLYEAAQACYERALPEYRRIADSVDDELHAKVIERLGWSELHDELAELAAALMCAVGIGEGDLMYPVWITEEDRDRRDRIIGQRLVAMHPDLVAMMAGAEPTP